MRIRRLAFAVDRVSIPDMAARLMKLAVDAVSNGSHTLMGGMTTEVSGATSPGSTEAVTEAIPAQVRFQCLFFPSTRALNEEII